MGKHVLHKSSSALPYQHQYSVRGVVFFSPGVNTNRQKQRLESFKRKIEIHRKEVRCRLQVRNLEVQPMRCPGSALYVSQLTK